MLINAFGYKVIVFQYHARNFINWHSTNHIIKPQRK